MIKVQNPRRMPEYRSRQNLERDKQSVPEYGSCGVAGAASMQALRDGDYLKGR